MLPTRAVWDPSLRAQIIARRSLLYSLPHAAGIAHVRAASGLCWFGRALIVVQDDALMLARVDPAHWRVDPIELPLGPEGERFFDVERGNKRRKTDLEACASVSFEGMSAVLAFGSGSSPARETLLLLTGVAGGPSACRTIHAPRLYTALRAHPGFATSELNLEGAVLTGTHLRLFQRSNGTRLGDAEIACATCDLAWDALERFLGAPDSAEVPVLENVQQVDLGSLGGARLTFTDAAELRPGEVAFVASAESSPNAIDDGEVQGTALGRFSASGARLCLLRDERGEAVKEKAEGIALSPDLRLAYVVFDPDDHRRPATLAEVALEGF